MEVAESLSAFRTFDMLTDAGPEIGFGFREGPPVRIDQLQPTPTSAPPLEIPAALMDSVLRHQAHLADLIVSFRAAGLDEAVVDASIRTLIDNYAEDLTAAIRSMMREPHCE